MAKTFKLKGEKQAASDTDRKRRGRDANRGQMLNRASLEVARLASTDEDRPTLCVLRITPERTIATNGAFLGMVTHPVVDRDVVEENAPVRLVSRPIQPCSIPRHVALDLAKLIPKGNPKEQPHHFAFMDLANSRGGSLRAVVKQADAVQSIDISGVQLEFPDAEGVVPKRRGAVMRFAISRHLLDVVLGTARRMGLDSELRFSIPDAPDKPILVEGGIKATEQEAVFVIMPLRSEELEKEQGEGKGDAGEPAAGS